MVFSLKTKINSSDLSPCLVIREPRSKALDLTWVMKLKTLGSLTTLMKLILKKKKETGCIPLTPRNRLRKLSIKHPALEPVSNSYTDPL